MKTTKYTLIVVLCLLYGNIFSQTWTEPIQISTQQGVNNHSDFCIDHLGHLHCVWSYKVASDYHHIYYSKSVDYGLTWSLPKNVSQNTDLWVENPHIVADSDNNLHLTYDYNVANYYVTQIVHRTFSNNTWSELDTVSVGWQGARHNRLVIDKNDKLYCFWFHDIKNGTTFYRTLENGVWGEIQIPYDNNDDVFVNNIAIDSLNNLYCIGNYFKQGQSPYDMRVIYFDFTDNEWSGLTQINNRRSWGATDIVLSDSHYKHIVWEQFINDSIPPDNGTLYSYHNGESWAPSVLLAENANEQTIAIDINNNIHIIDNEKYHNKSRLVHYRFINNEWVGNIIEEDKHGNYSNKLISRGNYLYLVSVKVKDNSSNYDASIVLRKYETSLGIEDPKLPIDAFKTYPNPATDYVSVEYALSKPQTISIDIYDLQGKLLNTIMNRRQTPGNYQIMWNGTDKNGKEVNSGLYLIRLQAGKQFITRSVEIIK